ncbi:hypothetical protein CDAR_256581 [Caerostris darwini]|uniref:Uncharacterized protein n=1 Tax=Caerostris darwini TaxID=1538125 RepID=A0AAV4PDJ0_9ARAC|nr:hypothetical protein CDAR_256581 [Caerostris darwini]
MLNFSFQEKGEDLTMAEKITAFQKKIVVWSKKGSLDVALSDFASENEDSNDSMEISDTAKDPYIAATKRQVNPLFVKILKFKPVDPCDVSRNRLFKPASITQLQTPPLSGVPVSSVLLAPFLLLKELKFILTIFQNFRTL